MEEYAKQAELLGNTSLTLAKSIEAIHYWKNSVIIQILLLTIGVCGCLKMVFMIFSKIRKMAKTISDFAKYSSCPNCSKRDMSDHYTTINVSDGEDNPFLKKT